MADTEGSPPTANPWGRGSKNRSPREGGRSSRPSRSGSSEEPCSVDDWSRFASPTVVRDFGQSLGNRTSKSPFNRASAGSTSVGPSGRSRFACPSPSVSPRAFDGRFTRNSILGSRFGRSSSTTGRPRNRDSILDVTIETTRSLT